MTLLIAVVKAEFPDSQGEMSLRSHFSLVVHKVENHIKSPRSLFSTGFAGFFMRGGQLVVKKVVSVGRIWCQKEYMMKMMVGYAFFTGFL